MSKSESQKGKSSSRMIDERIKELGETLDTHLFGGIRH